MIIVDEVCRAAEYEFVDFGGAAFVTGDADRFNKPDPTATQCLPVGIDPAGGVQWTWTVDFSQCEVGAP